MLLKFVQVILLISSSFHCWIVLCCNGCIIIWYPFTWFWIVELFMVFSYYEKKNCCEISAKILLQQKSGDHSREREMRENFRMWCTPGNRVNSLKPLIFIAKKIVNWMASPMQRTCVCVDSGRWWWTGRPGVLRFMGSHRVGHGWAAGLSCTDVHVYHIFLPFILQRLLVFFHILAAVNNVAEKKGCRVPLETLISFSLNIYPQIG